MKKWMKGFAVAGIILLCAGTGITALAGAVGGVNVAGYRGLSSIRNTAREIYRNSGMHGVYKDYDYDYDYEYAYEDYDHDEEYDDHEYSYDFDSDYRISLKTDMTLVASYENISSLDLSVTNGIVNVVENPELNNKIVIYQKEKEFSQIRHNLSSDSSKLSVEYDSRNMKKYQKGYYEEGIIEIPVGFHFREAEIDAAGAKVYVASIGADQLSLEAAGSEIKVDSFIAGNLSAEAQGGSLTARGEVTGMLEADAATGELILLVAGKEDDFNYQMEAAMGDISIGGSNNSGLVYERQISHGASKNAELSCSMGQIYMDFY